MMAGGAALFATGGLTYLMYEGHRTRMQMLANPQLQMQMFHPEVQNRLRKTLAYFGGACASTGFLMHMLRNSSLAYMNPFLFLALSFGMQIGIHATDYH